MRATVLLWSIGGGALLGLFIDALLVGLWMIASSLIPVFGGRPAPRWLSVSALLLLAAIPIASAVLGYLEGRLKTV